MNVSVPGNKFKSTFIYQFTIFLAGFLIAYIRERISNQSIWDHSYFDILSFIIMYYIAIHFATIIYIGIFDLLVEKNRRIIISELKKDIGDKFKIETFRVAIIIIVCIIFIWIIMNWPSHGSEEFF